MQGDIFVSLINNRLSPVYPCFNAEIHPFPLFPFRSSPLRKRTRNYKFPQWTDDSLALSLSFLFLSFTISFPSDPCNLLFLLSPLSGLSRSTLTLSPSLSLSSSLSLSWVLDSHILDPSFLSLSLSFVFSTSLLSLDASGLSRCTRVLNPSWMEKEARGVRGEYIWYVRVLNARRWWNGARARGQERMEDKWTHCKVLVQW